MLPIGLGPLCQIGDKGLGRDGQRRPGHKEEDRQAALHPWSFQRIMRHSPFIRSDYYKRRKELLQNQLPSKGWKQIGCGPQGTITSVVGIKARRDRSQSSAGAHRGITRGPHHPSLDDSMKSLHGRRHTNGGARASAESYDD